MGESFAAKYVIACVAATAAETVTFPLDITKTRLQIQGEHLTSASKHAYRGMIHTACGIVKEEGLLNLWRGVTPAVLRHFVYSGCRMPLYEYLREHVFKKDENGYFPLWKAVIGGMSAGAMGQFLASPTDLVKVQMQMEGRRELEGKKRRYRGTGHAFSVIVRENGVRGLWKGWLPNVQRAALVNLGDLTTYDTAKQFILRRTNCNDNWMTHSLSSAVSGLVATIMSVPADVIKTRIMNTPELYRGSVDCFIRAVKHEGFFSLYKGFFPTWARLAPWVTVFWLINEKGRILLGADAF